MNQTIKPIDWIGDAATGFVRLLDQTQLPAREVYLEVRDVQAMWQ